jgi:hypothetical protein
MKLVQATCFIFPLEIFNIIYIIHPFDLNNLFF